MNKLQILIYVLTYTAGLITSIIITTFTPIFKIVGELIVSRVRQLDFEIKESRSKVGVPNDKWRCFFEITIRNHFLDNTLEAISFIPPDERKEYTPIFHTKSNQMIELPIKMKPKDTIKLYYEHDISSKATFSNSTDLLAKFEFIAQDYYKHKYIAQYFVNFQVFKGK